MHMLRCIFIYACCALLPGSACLSTQSFQFESKRECPAAKHDASCYVDRWYGPVYFIRVPPTGGHARERHICMDARYSCTKASNLRLVACLTADHHLPRRRFSISPGGDMMAISLHNCSRTNMLQHLEAWSSWMHAELLADPVSS